MEQRIQSTLRHAASRARKTVQVGPFLATFTAFSPNPYLNYAIPEDGARPTQAEIAALVQVFASHARLPRLEYMSTAAPAVEPALLEAGFAIAGRLPLMTCPPDQLVEVPRPSGIELVTPAGDDDLFGMLLAQNEAYGEAPPTTDDVARRRTFLEAGGIACLARESATGIPVGGAICEVPFEGVAELAGLGVRAAYRRRGIAAALAAELTRVAHASGAQLVFLMAASDAEARIYQRVGFSPIGEILDLRYT